MSNNIGLLKKDIQFYKTLFKIPNSITYINPNSLKDTIDPPIIFTTRKTIARDIILDILYHFDKESSTEDIISKYNNYIKSVSNDSMPYYTISIPDILKDCGANYFKLAYGEILMSPQLFSDVKLFWDYIAYYSRSNNIFEIENFSAEDIHTLYISMPYGIKNTSIVFENTMYIFIEQ